METAPKVSVVIPVYNARDYVQQAVESALAQPETGEVILVEDDSPDGSLAICEELAQIYDTVELFHHPGGVNRGPGASRNLGIENARYDVIGFLDADDEMLPGRFQTALQILQDDPTIDGVYEAVKLDFMNEAAHEEWKMRAPAWYESGLARPLEIFPPEQLWEAFIRERPVFFHNNGITVRKAALARIGNYTVVPLHEDSLLCHKLAAKCKMVAGRMDEPVATYRVYGTNRTTETTLSAVSYKRQALIPRDALWLWSMENLTPQQEAQYFDYLVKQLRHIAKEYPPFLRRLYLFQAICRRVFIRPQLIGKRYLYAALASLFKA